MAYNRAPEKDNAPEMIERVVYLNRVSKTVKGGRVMKFSALVVVGDGNGTVGYGLGKAAEVSEAILKGIANAKKNLHKVTLSGTTIPHEVIGIYGAGSVLMKPASVGTGVIAGGAVRAVMEAVGITNIRTKCLRSNNPQNVVKATMQGLLSLRGPEEVARIRGKSVVEIIGLGGYEHGTVKDQARQEHQRSYPEAHCHGGIPGPSQDRPGDHPARQ